MRPVDSMSYCCDKCFCDEHLSAQIKRDGIVATCCLCKQRRRRCLDTAALRSLFEPLVSLYSNPVEYMPLESLKSGDQPTLSEKLVDDWGIFDDWQTARKFLAECREPYHPKHNPGPDPFDPDAWAGNEELYFDSEYCQATVLLERWEKLREELVHEKRFFAGRDLIDDLSTTIARLQIPLRARSVLYRARDCEKHKPHAEANMGAPPSALATAGRANPAGIAYLYLASNQKTAVSELRPHVGDSVAVGKFKLLQGLKVIDLRSPMVGSPFRWGKELPVVVRTMGFLRKLGQELSRPIGARRRDAEYLPTQFLCELIKTMEFDGVLYASGLGDGHNVALFDPSIAMCTQVEEVRISSVDVKFTEP